MHAIWVVCCNTNTINNHIVIVNPNYSHVWEWNIASEMPIYFPAQKTHSALISTAFCCSFSMGRLVPWYIGLCSLIKWFVVFLTVKVHTIEFIKVVFQIEPQDWNWKKHPFNKRPNAQCLHWHFRQQRTSYGLFHSRPILMLSILVMLALYGQ